MKKQIEGTKKFIGIDGYVYNDKGVKICRWVDNLGYYQVSFTENKIKRYFRIHRLVALYFIPNTNNCKQVNHKNGNKLDNSLNNLEWVNNSTNTKHAYDNGLYKSKYRCGVKSINKETKEVLFFKSVRECSSELNINRKTLTSILKKEKQNNYKYDFEYNL